MPAPKPALRISLEQARGIAVAAQGFPPVPGRSIVQVLEETGFVRTLGGVDIYLAVRARVPGMTRKIAGFWEYDPDAREVVYKGFSGLSAATRKKMDAAAQDLARFLADDIGHGRSFNLDTDEELRKRSAQIRDIG